MNRRAVNQLVDLTKQDFTIVVDLLLGESTVGFDARGLTGIAAVLVLEGTSNGSNWDALSSATGAQQLTADGRLTASTGGLHAVRLRVATPVAGAAGTANCYVSYVASTAAVPPASTFAVTAIDTVAIVQANQVQRLPNVPMALGGSIQNRSASDTIHVGSSNALQANGLHGWELAPGQIMGIAGNNLNQYWIVGPAVGDLISYAVN